MKASGVCSVSGFGRLLGESPAMTGLHPLLRRLAGSDVPVVISGETGTGKEVVAETLHEQGSRHHGPYVVFDCSAVHETLAESELFGHERGAFTGATGMRRGLFELAHGGTLFIDEIGDLDPALQPKLLRAVERGEIRRVGGARFLRFDVRVLSATRRDLRAEVAEGRFRDDLFHRLAVAHVELPPLRKRGTDISLLARHFWRALGGAAGDMDEELLARWAHLEWPGNVRELRNTVARLLAVGDLGEVPPFPSPSVVQGSSVDPFRDAVASRMKLPAARRQLVREFERRYIQRVLDQAGGDTVRAAAMAGIARRYFNILRRRAKSDG